MVANDDLEGKTTHFTGFYTHTISGPNIPKPPIVNKEGSRMEQFDDLKSFNFNILEPKLHSGVGFIGP